MNDEMMVTTEPMRKKTKEVEDMIGSLIGETKILEQRLTKINSTISGLIGLGSKEEKKDGESPNGYFPRLIRALGFLAQNIESIRKQVNELDNI
jgi:uncharacterized protein YukE